MRKGKIAHRHNIIKEINMPSDVPKNSLKMAPVYPIMAEISKCNKIRIRANAIGLNVEMVIIIFSIG